jgi:hypothetical protein
MRSQPRTTPNLIYRYSLKQTREAVKGSLGFKWRLHHRLFLPSTVIGVLEGFYILPCLAFHDFLNSGEVVPSH